MSTMLRGTEFHFQILIMQYESYSQGQNEIRFSSFCNYEFSKYVYVHVGECVCVCARLTEISTSGKRSELSIIKRSVNYNGGQVAQLPGHVRTVACASLSFAVWHKQKTCFISSTSLIIIQAPSGNWVYSWVYPHISLSHFACPEECVYLGDTIVQSQKYLWGCISPWLRPAKETVCFCYQIHKQVDTFY